MDRITTNVKPEIMKKLDKMGIYIINAKNGKSVKNPEYYNQVLTGLSIGFSNLEKEYNLNYYPDIVAFLHDFERPAASESFLHTTLKQELEKVYQKCREKNWQIIITFEKAPILNIYSIYVNVHEPGIDYDIVIQSTSSFDTSIRGGEAMAIASNDRHFLISF